MLTVGEAALEGDAYLEHADDLLQALPVQQVRIGALFRGVLLQDGPAARQNRGKRRLHACDTCVGGQPLVSRARSGETVHWVDDSEGLAVAFNSEAAMSSKGRSRT